MVFPVAVLIWYVFFGRQDTLAVAGLMLISVISFVDDVRNVPASLRFVIQIVAVSLLFYEIGILGYYWYWVFFAFLLTIGCINAFNFMDGINGITTFYSLVAFGTFSLLNNYNRLLAPVFDSPAPEYWSSFLPGRLVGMVFVSLLVFSFFNARKRAKTFAGDVGSISIAFILSGFMISLMVMSNSFFWILLFAVYGVDAGITILIRLRRRENILQPHRQHLYQLLVNEYGRPHLVVAALYAVAQMVVNAITLWLTFTGNMNLYVFLVMLTLISATYVVIRRQVTMKTM